MKVGHEFGRTDSGPRGRGFVGTFGSRILAVRCGELGASSERGLLTDEIKIAIAAGLIRARAGVDPGWPVGVE